ncbi:hypothetical protein [Parafrankia sp. EUN1f]|uniref:hypothetical protein n=1 Tax=Parafrankia sp. EUN1f TaxID=102897 RepID=UPI0001C47407|nr:hypothetical protein [Parafrankia sp. EUN1f]EFC86798.1 hypothetical protein FrEUN1fDRAFT_0049 [Parafrankia sp. EUN1f]
MSAETLRHWPRARTHSLVSCDEPHDRRTCAGPPAPHGGSSALDGGIVHRVDTAGSEGRAEYSAMATRCRPLRYQPNYAEPKQAPAQKRPPQFTRP